MVSEAGLQTCSRPSSSYIKCGIPRLTLQSTILQPILRYPAKSPMQTDGTTTNTQSQGAVQAPIDTTTTASSAEKAPIHTGIPLSTLTRPTIEPHQGHPGKSTSSSGSGHSSIRSTSHSASRIHKVAKAQNVFSNDGSFLERFQRLKRVRLTT